MNIENQKKYIYNLCHKLNKINRKTIVKYYKKGGELVSDGDYEYIKNEINKTIEKIKKIYD